MSHPRRTKTEIRTYERLVTGKHRLQRIYCHVPDVVRLYTERHSKNEWDEKDNRDDIAFLEIEKEIWKEQFPHRANHLDDEDGSEEEGEEEEEVEDEEVESEEEEEVLDDESTSSSSSSNSSDCIMVKRV